MRVDDDVDGFMSEELFRRAYTVHPYMWPTIGWMQDIKNLNLDDCVGFLSDVPAPNNATVVVVGDIDEQKRSVIVKALRWHRGSADSSTHVQVTEPPQNEPRLARFKNRW